MLCLCRDLAVYGLFLFFFKEKKKDPKLVRALALENSNSTLFYHSKKPLYHCQWRFCDKGRKCENGPNLSLSSLEVFIMKNQVQNSKCIMNKVLITKVQKKHKNITDLKFRPTVSEKKKLREVVRKRGKVPLYPYFHL